MADLGFGTDGVRGVANTELTPEFCLRLGRVVARVLGPGPFLVGRDTRLSGPSVQAALAAGITASGADVIDLGILPTPVIAWASARHHLPAAVISASHNPFQDNGIKFFQAGGLKLGDLLEQRIETGSVPDAASGGSVGDITTNISVADEYVDHLVALVEPLHDIRIVVDCANGANTATAPRALRALGADVKVIFDRPDGRNINQGCGSTHPQALMRAVVENEAQLGLAFDGDGDRVLAVDEKGALIDGDHILGMLAIDARSRNDLKDDTLVVTVMSNLGLRLGMERAGVKVHQTKVGDRHVLEAMERHGWNLGGEQSGHIVLRDFSTTGDGLLVGLRIADLVRQRGVGLSRLAADTMTRLPQVLRNVRVDDRDRLPGATAVWDAVRAVEDRLGNGGRVLLRPSGTEQLIRVMVEAPTATEADAVCDELCAVVERTLTR